MALDGIERINQLVSKIVKRAPKAGASEGADFREYAREAYERPLRTQRERGDSVDISLGANKLAAYARELIRIRSEMMEKEGRGDFVEDGNPWYLEDTARAYNALREKVTAKYAKSPAALSTEVEILNVVLERTCTEEARELAQSVDMHTFTMYITHGEAMCRERLWNINGKYLKSFFYLLNTMTPERAEQSASALLRKGDSQSLEQLSYQDITRLKEFGRHNKSLSLAAKWNMLSRDKTLSEPLRHHFAMLYNHNYGVKSANQAAAKSSTHFHIN